MNELLRLLNLDLVGFANFMRTLLSLPLLRGRVVEGVLPAGKTSVEVQHGLERPFQGGFLMAASYSAPLTVTMGVKDSNPNETYRSLDPTKVVLIEAFTAYSNDVAFKMWIY